MPQAARRVRRRGALLGVAVLGRVGAEGERGDGGVHAARLHHALLAVGVGALHQRAVAGLAHLAPLGQLGRAGLARRRRRLLLPLLQQLVRGDLARRAGGASAMRAASRKGSTTARGAPKQLVARGSRLLPGAQAVAASVSRPR